MSIRLYILNLKTIPKGLIVIEKRRLEFDPFLPFQVQFFEFCGPFTRDANSDKKKGGNPF